jgi:hypothetical protein
MFKADTLALGGVFHGGSRPEPPFHGRPVP